MASDDLIIFQAAQDILACVLQGLIDDGLPIPCRVCVVPGDIAWDNCADGGQLELSINNVYYTTQFPVDTSSTDTTERGICNIGIPSAVMTISLMRCAPMPAGLTAKAPSCEQLTETAKLIAQDNYVIRTSIQCCLDTMRRDVNNALTDWRFSPTSVEGPSGGCVGNSVDITVGFIKG